MKRRVARAEEEAQAASKVTPEDVRKMRLTFFLLRGIIHYIVARIPGYTVETYPEEDVDDMIREIMKKIIEAVDMGAEDENIETSTILRSQHLCDQLLYGARKAYKEAQKQASRNGVHCVDREAYEEAVEAYLEAKVEELSSAESELCRPIGSASEGAEPEDGSRAEDEGDEARRDPGGGAETQPEDEESGGDVSPPLPEYATKPCPRCGGPPVFKAEVGEWLCLSCSSPLRLLWRRMKPR